MVDEQHEQPDLSSLMPFDLDSASRERPESFAPVPREQFLYIGRALTADEFTEYVRTYDFGPIPPDYVVLHHTGNPATSQARPDDPNVGIWDSGEAGMDTAAIIRKRLGRLENIKEFYRTSPALEWDRGPHLYIDDRFIYLFSPMAEESIHAMWGNALTDRQGNYHYSISIEVVGYYEHVRWPEPVARLVGHAVAVLKRRLGTFDLDYMYPDPAKKPGRVVVTVNGKLVERCPHPERLTWGGIASHRDYNKPACPGKAISEAFYMEVLRQGWENLTRGQGGAATDPNTLLERFYQANKTRLGAKRFAGRLQGGGGGISALEVDAAGGAPTLVCEQGVLAVVGGVARDVTASCLDQFVADNERAGRLQRF